MPSTWQIPLTGAAGAGVPLTAPLAVVSGWLDARSDGSQTGSEPGLTPDAKDARSRHDAQARPWSVTPPQAVGRQRTVLEVRLLDDGLRDRLARVVVPGARVRLGSQHFTVADTASQVAAVGWEELARWSGERAWQVRFASPTTFRRGNRTSPWPDPVSVIRGLRARWDGLGHGPAPEPTRGSVWVSDVDGRSDAVAMRGTVVTGFIGRLRYVCDGSAEDAAAFAALMAFGRFAGVGSHTTAGFGCIIPEPTPQPRARGRQNGHPEDADRVSRRTSRRTRPVAAG